MTESKKPKQPSQEFESLYERERIAKTICSELNNFTDLKTTLQTIIVFLKELTGTQAISIRLHDEGDYPYYVYEGFPKKFIQKENSLCARDNKGRRIKNPDGKGYILDCMCGNVIHGRFDVNLPFFSKNGSFWSNNTSKLLASTTTEDRQGTTRNYCNSQGYESVALIPIKARGENFGLIQFNDKKIDKFNEEMIQFLEMIGEEIGLAVRNSMIFSKLQEAHESTNFLFSIIAHDIIGPFSTLNTYLEFLDQHFHELSQDEIKQHLARLNRNSKGVYELLDNLFTWSSIQREKFLLVPEELNLKEIIDEIFGVLSERAIQKEIDLNHSLTGDFIVHTDKNALRTIIRNLISNAVKFTNSGGKVSVSGIKNDISTEISVKDTGIGMDDKNLINFSNLDPKKKRRGTDGEQGTGLGLIICRQLTKKIQGKLSVNSNLGSGSEFILSVPSFGYLSNN